MKSSTLLLKILIDKKSIQEQDLPQSAGGWNDLIFFAHRNKLIYYLHAFVTKNDLKFNLSPSVDNHLKLFYTYFLLRRHHYEEIKQKIIAYAQKNKIPLILIKDFEADKFFKYDLDILEKQNDIKKNYRLAITLGYEKQIRHYYFRQIRLDQYKLKPIKTNSLLPFIEFRYQAITIAYPSKRNISQKQVQTFTEDLWKNSIYGEDGLLYLPQEYVFVHLCLICYFEDLCKGLNNLFRIYLFMRKYKKELHWQKIYSIGKKYQVSAIIKFVIYLTEKIFNPENVKGKQISFPFRFAEEIVTLDYVCSPERKKNPRFWKERYLFFLTRGLLLDEPILKKILFFLHPKRLFFLIYGIVVNK